jgi:hypothetical protein
MCLFVIRELEILRELISRHLQIMIFIWLMSERIWSWQRTVVRLESIDRDNGVSLISPVPMWLQAVQNIRYLIFNFPGSGPEDAQFGALLGLLQRGEQPHVLSGVEQLLAAVIVTALAPHSFLQVLPGIFVYSADLLLEVPRVVSGVHGAGGVLSWSKVVIQGTVGISAKE